MIVPLGTDRPLRRTPVVTPALVVLTLGAWVMMLLVERVDPEAYQRALGWSWLIGGEGFRWWMPLTATLVHADVLHVAGNMLFLWVFGRAVEDRYRWYGFLGLYVVGAYVAGAAHIWTSPAPAVGASGAVSAVTGAFLVLFPKTWIRSFYLLGFRVILVPAWFLIGFAIAFDLLSQTFGVRNDVANAAHLGGYALGGGLSVVLLWARVFPREPYDLFTVVRQALRRRKFKAAVADAEPSKVRADRRVSKAEQERSEALAAERAVVSEAVAAGDDNAVAASYGRLVRDHADEPGAATLPRGTLHGVIASLVRAGADDALTAGALHRFVDAYPKDPEADGFRVLLARVLVRLGRSGEARALLAWTVEHTRDDAVRGIAEEELESLGAPRPSGTNARGGE